MFKAYMASVLYLQRIISPIMNQTLDMMQTNSSLVQTFTADGKAKGRVRQVGLRNLTGGSSNIVQNFGNFELGGWIQTSRNGLCRITSQMIRGPRRMSFSFQHLMDFIFFFSPSLSIFCGVGNGMKRIPFPFRWPKRGNTGLHDQCKRKKNIYTFQHTILY